MTMNLSVLFSQGQLTYLPQCKYIRLIALTKSFVQMSDKIFQDILTLTVILINQIKPVSSLPKSQPV